MVIENFDFKKKKCFIVDPFAGKSVEAFAKSIGAKLVSKHLNDLDKNDFQ